MNPREVKSWGRSEWEKARERGKRHFILHYGLVGFAVPLALLMLVYFYVAEPMLFDGAGLGDMLPIR